MAKNTRKCLLCGCEYKFCNNCNSQKLPAWHTLFHDDNCHNIWDVLCDFENGHITKEEAKEKLDGIDASIIKEPTAVASYNKIFDIVQLEESAPVEGPTPVVEEDVAQTEETTEAKDDSEEPLSVSEELKKHNNNRHKYNKKN